jgi:hypothetical protein
MFEGMLTTRRQQGVCVCVCVCLCVWVCVCVCVCVCVSEGDLGPVTCQVLRSHFSRAQDTASGKVRVASNLRLEKHLSLCGV